MIYITLICAAGLSTSMLMSKMKKAAAKENIAMEITAMPEGKFESYSGKTDVLLLGPQVGYLKEDMVKEYEPKGIKVDVINMMDYGMMDGEKVVRKALLMLNGGDKNE